MVFPAGCSTTRGRVLNGLVALTLLMALLPTAAADADDPPPPPPLRHLQYTVFAERPYKAEIYYHHIDPSNWGEYSHNPYLYSPNIEVDVGADGCDGDRDR